MANQGTTRRAVLAGSAASAVLAALPARAKAGESVPNILWLVSEDNNPFIGAYGDKLAKTPNIDRLAASGILYRNAYCSAPVCAPSRFGLLTGVLPEACGPANHMRADAVLPPELRTCPELLRAAGYYCTNNAKTDYNSDVAPARIWDESSPKAHWRNRPAGRPFMAMFTFMSTHESSFFRAQPAAMSLDQIHVPAYLPDTEEMRQEYAKYYNLMEEMDGEVGAHLADLDAAGVRDDTIIFYFGDNGGVLPGSKRYCHDEGLRVPLIVSVPEKWRHLAPAAPGSVIEAPVTLTDLVPSALSLAGLDKTPQMHGNALLGSKMEAPKRYAFGMRNRMDERYDMVRTVTDGRYRYIRNYMPHRPMVQHQAFAWLAKGYQAWERAYRAGTLNAAQRAPFEPRVYEEFYDLQADPDQVTNLIGAGAHRRRIAAMRKALDAHMIAVNDNGFIPEGGEHEGYRESRVPGAYPLRRVMALASAAARRDPRKRALLTAALDDPQEVMRYWGAMGLLILGESAQPARDRLRTAMTDDASPRVRIVAAEAAARLGDGEQAVGQLQALLANGENEAVRLQAINALTYIGEPARAALPQIRAAAQSEDESVRNAGRYLSAVMDGRYVPSLQIFDVERMLQQMRNARPAS